MPATYEPIVTANISGNPLSVTLGSGGTGSIPSTYTDLRLIVHYSFGSAFGLNNAAIYVNQDTSSLYSTTEIGGNGTAASSARQNNAPGWLITFPIGSPTTSGSGIIIADIFSYSNTNIFKTALIRHNVPGADAAPGLQQGIHLYRSTNAISSITLIGNSGSTLAQGTLTLYGIKAA